MSTEEAKQTKREKLDRIRTALRKYYATVSAEQFEEDVEASCEHCETSKRDQRVDVISFRSEVKEERVSSA